MASARPTSLMRTIIGSIAARAFWLLYTKAASAMEMTHSASTVIFRYVFITSGSPHCSRYFSAARVRSGSLIVTSKRVLQHPCDRGCNNSAQPAAMPSDVSGEKAGSHGRNLEKNEPSYETKHKKTRHDHN